MKDRFKTIDSNFDSGGFGKIVVVDDIVLERKVAIKRLKLMDEENRERFEKEAKILASFSHPNIPAIYDIEFTDTEMNIEFQFVEGKNLRKIINEKLIPSVEEVRKWFTQIAIALDYAHTKGVLHRDIKPENIIISEDRSNAFLVDFGIALSSSDGRVDRQYVIGTPGYIAPEYTESGILANSSDIFALGITLYETLTSSIPAYDTYSNISDSNDTIPPAIDDLVKRCIVKDYMLRLQSAREFDNLINSSFNTAIPFSSLLTESRLFDIQQTLKNMSAEEFHAKPTGQRVLVMLRVKDLVKVKNHTMLMATAEMLKVLVRICVYEDVEYFKFIFSSSIEWGFDIQFGDNWVGDPELRAAISSICKILNKENCKIASIELLNYLKVISLSEKPKWYLHDMRPVVMALLANPNITQNILELGKLYEDINAYSHKYSEDGNSITQ